MSRRSLRHQGVSEANGPRRECDNPDTDHGLLPSVLPNADQTPSTRLSHGRAAYRPRCTRRGHDDAVLLEDTVDSFLWSAQYVVDHAFKGEYVTTSKTTARRRNLRRRTRANTIHANLVQNARNKAADAVQSAVARWKQGEYAGGPHFTSPTVVYDKRCATFHDEYVSLATVEDRIEVEYLLPAADRDTPHRRYLDSDDYQGRAQNCTTETASGSFISVQTRRWSLTRRNWRRPGTDSLGVDLDGPTRELRHGRSGASHEFDHETRVRGPAWLAPAVWHAGRSEIPVGRREGNGPVQTDAPPDCQRYHRRSRRERVYDHRLEELSGTVTDSPKRRVATRGSSSRLYEYVISIRVARELIRSRNSDSTYVVATLRVQPPGHRDSEAFVCLKCGYENHADYNAAKNIASAVSQS